MKIYLGPAGVPLSSKKHTSVDGIKIVSGFGLQAMECEFVHGVRMSRVAAKEVAEVNKEYGIKLSVHAPYFINLNSQKKEIIDASKKMIFDSADRGEIMGAEAIAIHSAYYSGASQEETFEKVEEGFLDILDKMKSHGIKKIKLGVETMAKESQFGTLDETIELCKKVKGVIPYIDWAHLFARNDGKINFEEVFDKLEPLKLEHIHSHFEGLKYNTKTMKFVDVHVPINSHPPFEPLAKEILKRKIDITIISESPLLEQDSLKMKKILENLGHKF